MSKVVSVAFALFLALTGALARQRDPFDEKMASIILLQSKVVQRELGITEHQRAAMNKYADAHRMKLNAYYQQVQGKGSVSVDDSKLRSMFETLKKGVLAQLSASQVKRLREISVQTLDFTGLADPLIAQRIGLSSAQTQKVQHIVAAGMADANAVRERAVEGAIKPLQSRKPKTADDQQRLQAEADRRAEAAVEQVTPQILLIKSDTKKKTLAVLTAQQKARWHALMGTPLKG